MNDKQKDWEEFTQEAQNLIAKFPEKVEADPESAGNGLVKLVLSLVNLLTELMEKQALRRIENDSLTEEQIERLGLTFIKLEEKMEELKTHFDLTEDDLKLGLSVQDMG
ncbi:MAG: gas vesicle protein K [Bacteroidota bacterium]